MGPTVSGGLDLLTVHSLVCLCSCCSCRQRDPSDGDPETVTAIEWTHPNGQKGWVRVRPPPVGPGVGTLGSGCELLIPTLSPPPSRRFPSTTRSM